MKIIHIISNRGVGKEKLIAMIEDSNFDMAVDVSLSNLDMHFKFAQYDKDLMPYCIAIYGDIHVNAINGVVRRKKASVYSLIKLVGVKMKNRVKAISEYYDSIDSIEWGHG